MKIKIGVLSDTHLYRMTKEMEEIYSEWHVPRQIYEISSTYKNLSEEAFKVRVSFTYVYQNNTIDEIEAYFTGVFKKLKVISGRAPVDYLTHPKEEIRKRAKEIVGECNV